MKPIISYKVIVKIKLNTSLASQELKYPFFIYTKTFVVAVCLKGPVLVLVLIQLVNDITLYNSHIDQIATYRNEFTNKKKRWR